MRATRGIRLDEVIELLGLAKLLERSPHNLSGGERQRVAIGRALLSQPKLLLMDEPLSALDRPTKNEILPFLERLHERLSLPVIYVSHDMAEIERLADHLILMQPDKSSPPGRCRCCRATRRFRSPEPAKRRSASTPRSKSRHRLWIADASRRRRAPACSGSAGRRRQTARLRIAASDVSIAGEAPGTSSILNVLPARIVSKSLLGHGEVIVVLALGADGAGAQLLARITLRSWDLLGLAEGMNVFAQVKGVSLVSGADAAYGRAAASRVVLPEKSAGNSAAPPVGARMAEPGNPEIPGKPSARDAMTVQDINPNHLAAILYRPEDDVDALLADFASARLRDGERIGGIVQRNHQDEDGRATGMDVVDLLTGREISICLPLAATPRRASSIPPALPKHR